MKTFLIALFLVLGVAQATSSISFRDALYKLKSDNLAVRGQFPWHASVDTFNQWGPSYCAGVLISPRWVLTSGFCANGNPRFKVILGGLERTNQNEPGVIYTETRAGFKHEHWNWNFHYENNIGLVDLGRDVTLTANIQPIRLPSRSAVNETYLNLKATLSGYNPTLKYKELEIISNKECVEHYMESLILDEVICARDSSGDGIVIGDYGAPLVYTEDDGISTLIAFFTRYHKAGINSDHPGLFTNAAKHLDWISEKTGIQIRD